jgi:protein gp37
MARGEASQTWPRSAILIFVGDMSDLFHEGRDAEVIGSVCAIIALSDHIGLLLTKRTARMADYFGKQSRATVHRSARIGAIVAGPIYDRWPKRDGLSLFPSRQ